MIYIYQLLVGMYRSMKSLSVRICVTCRSITHSRQILATRSLSKSGYSGFLFDSDTFLEPFEESSDEESEAEEEEAASEVIITESSEFLLDDYMPLPKGRYVDMSSDLVEVQEDVVAYGQEEEFLFDQDD